MAAALAQSLLGGCGDSSPSPEVVRGQQVYARYCALCHGDRGEGLAAPRASALSNAEFLSVASDEFLRAALTKGRPGTSMSAFCASGGPLDAAACDDLLAMLRAWRYGATPELDQSPFSGSADRGARLYGAMCAGCHGAHGEGAAFQSLANPEFRRTASVGYLRYVIRHGRRGTYMPAFPDLGGASGADDLIALMLSW